METQTSTTETPGSIIVQADATFTSTKGDISISAIAQDEYDILEHYYKYACASYHMICPRPNGQHFVGKFIDIITDTQGLVARDDERKEIIVALRGSTSPMDFIIDAQILLLPLLSPGVVSPEGVRVHFGFITSWNTVALQVIRIVRRQLEKYPTYGVVTTGHSLGGSLALLAAVSMQSNFPESVVRTYSYGAPRVGNKEFAQFVRKLFGLRAHRVVHSNDGVPTMIPTLLGYRHHGVEYWLKTEPCSPDNTMKFTEEDGEDQSGSASKPSRGINLAHTLYFGIVAGTPFCF